MTGHRIYALGSDPYWLKAVTEIADRDISVEPVQCEAGVPCLDCLERLPAAVPNALLLVDCTGHAELVRVVQTLRCRGWRYVVVLAADPSWKEASSVLRGDVAYDYWEKSYALAVIRQHVQRCLAEIQEHQEGDGTPDGQNGK